MCVRVCLCVSAHTQSCLVWSLTGSLLSPLIWDRLLLSAVAAGPASKSRAVQCRAEKTSEAAYTTPATLGPSMC